MTEDEKYMARCIQLAKNGKLNAQPNPMVGAVVVHEGRIIGEGYHVKCGEGHAEVNALASVKSEDRRLLKEATIYVSLEPCAHYGKTPPCADLIVREGLKRVVVGCIDPFAKVHGLGIKKIKEAGIEVTVGVLEKECMELNKRFMTFHRLKRPFVTLKWAETADGFIGADESSDIADELKGKPLIISNAYTRMVCHKRRAEHQAIMVGRRTAEMDNPSLTVRDWYGPDPIRIVTDRQCRLSPSLTLFDNKIKTLVLCSDHITEEKESFSYMDSDLYKAKKNCENIEFIPLDFSRDIIPQIMKTLYERGIQTLLVEGGAVLLQSFIDSGIYDEVYIEKGNFTIGSGTKAPRITDK